MQSIIARGAHTAYLDSNPNASSKTPIVLCLHGIASSSYMYRNVTNDLAFKARVITPDLPGFGQSQKKCPWELSLSAYTLWLDDFIEQVIGKDQRFHLILHDISGPVGLNWAINNQNRIKSLLLLNTSIFIEHFRPPLIALAGAIPRVGNRILHWAMQPQRLKTIWQREFSSPVNHDEINQYCSPYDDSQSCDALAEVFNQFPQGVSLLHQLRSQLKSLQIPCTILFGASDKYCKPANATAFAQIIDGATLRFIQGVGHFIAEDAPYAVSEEMRELMKKTGEHLGALSCVTPIEDIEEPRRKLAS